MSSWAGGCMVCGRALGSTDLNGRHTTCPGTNSASGSVPPTTNDLLRADHERLEAEVKRLSDKLARAEKFVAAFDAWWGDKGIVGDHRIFAARRVLDEEGHAPGAPGPYLAVGNNEPIPEGLPDGIVALLSESRRAQGWCDHGLRLNICPEDATR